MKYTVYVDASGYVTSITQTGRDFVELNLEDYDLSDGRIRAYKLGRNKLIFDEQEYQNILNARQKAQDEAEIKDLEQKLNDTDYIMARITEELLGLNNPLTWITDVIKLNVKYTKQYAEAIANRKKWRERIEELRK